MDRITNRIVIADPIDATALQMLSQSFEVVDVSADPAQLPQNLPEAAGLLVRSRTKVDESLMKSAPKLKVIGRAGVGVDNVDIAAAHRHGIVIVNAPAAATTSVAELTLGLMLAAARNFATHIPSMKGGTWSKGGNGLELSGRTAGLVGYGRIAKEVALRLKAIGMKVEAFDPFVNSPPDGTRMVTLEELLKSSDVVSLHASATGTNRHLLDRNAFKKMKKGAILINVARGMLVDEEALLEALEEGRLSAAALDVFEEEPPRNQKLLAHPRLIATPHIGASTKEAQERAGLTVALDIARVLRGEKPEFPVGNT